jgi:membrane-bound metal-dependent hydrolase YbcI (DUF457 family)
MLLGHLAVSILEHRYLKADLAPVVVGGVFPDVVDKTLCHVLRLRPHSRTFGHTLVGMVISTGIVGLIWGQRAARSWALGYLSHLLGDVQGFVPWLYPLVRYDFPPPSPGLLEIVLRALSNPVQMGLELGLAVWAMFACVQVPTAGTELRK